METYVSTGNLTEINVGEPNISGYRKDKRDKNIKLDQTFHGSV